MIEVANAGMIISEKCGEACELEYFEMFAHKKKLEGEILQVCRVMEKCCPVENSDMFVQFPNHESMLTSIKLCAYLVRGEHVCVCFVWLNEQNIHSFQKILVSVFSNQRCFGGFQDYLLSAT